MTTLQIDIPTTKIKPVDKLIKKEIEGFKDKIKSLIDLFSKDKNKEILLRELAKKRECNTEELGIHSFADAAEQIFNVFVKNVDKYKDKGIKVLLQNEGFIQLKALGYENKEFEYKLSKDELEAALANRDVDLICKLLEEGLQVFRHNPGGDNNRFWGYSDVAHKIINVLSAFQDKELYSKDLRKEIEDKLRPSMTY